MGLHLKTILGVCNDLKLLYKDHSLESSHCILDTSAATTTYSKSWVRVPILAMYIVLDC
jgi:hypothetical protein